jgi:hypothetical protein
VTAGLVRSGSQARMAPCWGEWKMATYSCKDCGGIVAYSSKRCVHCGSREPFDSSSSSDDGMSDQALRFVFGFGAFGALYAAYLVFQSDSAKVSSKGGTIFVALLNGAFWGFIAMLVGGAIGGILNLVGLKSWVFLPIILGLIFWGFQTGVIKP